MLTAALYDSGVIKEIYIDNEGDRVSGRVAHVAGAVLYPPARLGWCCAFIFPLFELHFLFSLLAGSVAKVVPSICSATERFSLFQCSLSLSRLCGMTVTVRVTVTVTVSRQCAVSSNTEQPMHDRQSRPLTSRVDGTNNCIIV
jgi:hypothetical protein